MKGIISANTKSKYHVKRNSISADCNNMFKSANTYIPKLVPKTQDQHSKISMWLQNIFLFSHLNEYDKTIVINSMEYKYFSQGQFIIKQEEEGNELFIIEQGELECFQYVKNINEEKFLRLFTAGDVVGELALLYNSPRTASVRAKTDCYLYSLDRECFTKIVKNSLINQKNKYFEFISNVEVLQNLDPFEKLQMVDALKVRNFKTNDILISQGDDGDEFFIVESGQLFAIKQLNSNEEPKIVYQYAKGNYFGEIALLEQCKRQASVIAKTDGRVLVLNRNQFKQHLAPLEQILINNKIRYNLTHQIQNQQNQQTL